MTYEEFEGEVQNILEDEYDAGEQLPEVMRKATTNLGKMYRNGITPGDAAEAVYTDNFYWD